MQRTPWPVDWSASFVGAWSALAAAFVFGLIGTIIGTSAPATFSSWRTVSLIDLIFVIAATFFAFAIGGWVAGKISGYRFSETTILHGAITWLLALAPISIGLASGQGLGRGFLAASPLVAAATSATTAPEVVRNTALAALIGVLVALVGAVIGGWMASGEPMNFSHHRTRTYGAAASEGVVR
jgi:MFS family permease